MNQVYLGTVVGTAGGMESADDELEKAWKPFRPRVLSGKEPTADLTIASVEASCRFEAESR